MKKVVPLPFEIPAGVTHWALAPLAGGEAIGRAVDGVTHFEWPIGDLTIEIVREWFGAGAYFCYLLGKGKKPGSAHKGARAIVAKRKLVLSMQEDVSASAAPQAAVSVAPPVAAPFVMPLSGDPLTMALSLFQVINQSAETSARRAIESDRNFMTQALAVVMGGREVRARAEESNAAIASALTAIASRLDRLEEEEEPEDDEEEEEEEERERDPIGTPKDEALRAMGKMVRENAPGAVVAVGNKVGQLIDHVTRDKTVKQPTTIGTMGEAKS